MSKSKISWWNFEFFFSIIAQKSFILNCSNIVCLTIYVFYGIHFFICVKRLFYPMLIICIVFIDILSKKNILEKNWMCKRTWKNWTPISCDISRQNLSFDVEILNLFSSQFLKKLQSEIGFGRINNLWYIPFVPSSLGPHLSSICMKLARGGEIWSQTRWDKGYVWKSIILL